MAALLTNKRYGEDATKDPMMIHRMELKKKSMPVQATTQDPGAEQLREQRA
ncbi:MAG: hypothetical protein IH609_06510 [Dehalococcoidia bacterium]|nr:hypothetical protein [Dehalococcoidia bacterium]